MPFLWIFGPSREEKSKRLYSFDKHLARSLRLRIADPPFLRQTNIFFKVCLVGTLNLCLRVPDKMQKTRGKSDPYRLRKLP